MAAGAGRCRTRLDDGRNSRPAACASHQGERQVWRFYDRNDITFRESLHAAEQDREDIRTARTKLETREAAA
jgi:hypothetical protein